MKKDITCAGVVAAGIEAAWENVTASFERFCLTAGVATLAEMMERDAVELCGPRHGRNRDRRGHRWGRSTGKLGFHGGKVSMERPRVRARGGAELGLPSWEAAQAEDWLGRWAMNLMLINVSTRRFRACGASARGRPPGWPRRRRIEVRGLTSVRGLIG
jgi:putative transposase